MISSLMHDSLGRRLDSYINNSNSSNNNSSSNSNSNSSSAGNSIAGVPKEFIDFTGAHREATTLMMMMKSLSPGRRKEQARSSAEDELETTEFTEQEVVIKSSSSSNNSPSTLIDKLSQHLEGKEEQVQLKPTVPNGKIATVTTTTSSPQPEIWSEAESETDGSISSVPKFQTPSKRRTIISSPRLLAAPKIGGPPRPLSSPTPANFLPRASVASSASKTSSPSASIGNGHISSSSSSGAAVPPAFPADPKKSFSFPPKHTTTTTLLTILRLPNMRRKCLVLFFLSATHTTLYVAFTYFVADFTAGSMLTCVCYCFWLLTFLLLLISLKRKQFWQPSSSPPLLAFHLPQSGRRRPGLGLHHSPSLWPQVHLPLGKPARLDLYPLHRFFNVR